MKKSDEENGNGEPPRHLSVEAREFWRRVVKDFSIIDPAGLLLVRTAAECLDQMRAGQKLLKRDGLIIVDRFKQRRAHPATVIVKDARSQLLAALRALHLDLEPIGDVGRPPREEY